MSDFLSSPVGQLKTDISELATWQTITGAANATAALAFIFIDAEVSPAFPYLIIDDDSHNEGSLALDILTPGGNFTTEGMLNIIIGIEIPVGSNRASMATRLQYGREQVGPLIEEMGNSVGRSGAQNLRRIERLWGPAIPTKAERRKIGDFVEFAWRTRWT